MVSLQLYEGLATVADSDLQIKSGGGHPDPEIRGGGGLKTFFWPFGPQFTITIKGGGPPGPLLWIRHCTVGFSNPVIPT